MSSNSRNIRFGSQDYDVPPEIEWPVWRLFLNTVPYKCKIEDLDLKGSAAQEAAEAFQIEEYPTLDPGREGLISGFSLQEHIRFVTDRVFSMLIVAKIGERTDLYDIMASTSFWIGRKNGKEDLKSFFVKMQGNKFWQKKAHDLWNKYHGEWAHIV